MPMAALAGGFGWMVCDTGQGWGPLVSMAAVVGGFGWLECDFQQYDKLSACSILDLVFEVEEPSGAGDYVVSWSAGCAR